jgi:hypothetical protein
MKSCLSFSLIKFIMACVKVLGRFKLDLLLLLKLKLQLKARKR